MSYEAIAIWSQVVAAVLFLALLVWGWMKFITPVLLAAEQAHNAQIKETERHRDEAKAALETLHSEIDGAQRDADAIRARAVEQSTHERAAAIAEATAAGERALQNAGMELDRARSAARDRLRDELLEKALRLAKTTAAARVDASVESKLVDAFAESLTRGGAN